MKHMSHVTQQVNIEQFNPREKDDVHLKRDSNIVNVNTQCHIEDIVFFSPTVLD